MSEELQVLMLALESLFKELHEQNPELTLEQLHQKIYSKYSELITESSKWILNKCFQ